MIKYQVKIRKEPAVNVNINVEYRENLFFNAEGRISQRLSGRASACSVVESITTITLRCCEKYTIIKHIFVTIGLRSRNNIILFCGSCRSS